MPDSTNKIAVSIICPVYNAQKTLSRCVDSILSQSFEDWELILVDDGSTDGSSDVCDAYALADSRIKVLHKHNEGVSSARQSGMEMASGDYFSNIDPDDWIGPEWLGKMFRCVNEPNYEIAISDFMMVFSNGSKLSRQCHPWYSPRRIALAISGGRLSHSICNKLIKRSFYDDNNLSFPTGLEASEDALICHSLLIKGARCCFCKDVYYYYDRYSNDNSLTRVKLERIIRAVDDTISILKGIDGDIRIRNRAVKTLMSVAKMKAFYSLPYEEFRDLYKSFNLEYVFRNICKITKVEGYVALGLIIRDNKKALSIFHMMKRLIGRNVR